MPVTLNVAKVPPFKYLCPIAETAPMPRARTVMYLYIRNGVSDRVTAEKVYECW